MSYHFNKDFAGQGVVHALAEPFEGKSVLILETATERELEHYYNYVAACNTDFVIKSETKINNYNNVSEDEKQPPTITADRKATSTETRPRKKRTKKF